MSIKTDIVEEVNFIESKFAGSGHQTKDNMREGYACSSFALLLFGDLKKQANGKLNFSIGCFLNFS